MTNNEFEYISNIVAAFNESPTKLGPWERTFMSDTAQRLEKYGNDTHFSVKQWAIVDKVAAKYEIER